jgi:hypothetical protein
MGASDGDRAHGQHAPVVDADIEARRIGEADEPVVVIGAEGGGDRRDAGHTVHDRGVRRVDVAGHHADDTIRPQHSEQPFAVAFTHDNPIGRRVAQRRQRVVEHEQQISIRMLRESLAQPVQLRLIKTALHRLAGQFAVEHDDGQAAEPMAGDMGPVLIARLLTFVGSGRDRV